ncbi:MAG TPA: hypothetical protein VIS74_06745 [Chthoniobacterales bacterium]
MPSDPKKIPELVTRRQKANLPKHETALNFFSNSLFAWTLFILLLIGIAIVSWFGSFYIFGHPEEPLNYQILSKLKKIEEPKRFELTEAPRGEFLTANELLARYGKLTRRELAKVNGELLRNYIRNFNQTKAPLAYIVGNFNILDSYELKSANFFPTGVVALAQSTENSRVLLEHVFTADPKTIPTLHRTLLTGLDIDLKRRQDISAVIHVEKLKDGRLKLTAIPLLYGSYASTEGPGSFSLEPPAVLNPEGGLPILGQERVDEALQKYAQYRRRAGLSESEPGVPRATAANQLTRVERPPDVAPTPSPAPPAVAVVTPEPRVLPAMPVATPVPTATPLLQPFLAASPSPTLTPSPTPTPATPAPAPTRTPEAAIASAAGRNWQVYGPGQMPRGRLLNLPDVPELANRGLGGERLYLQGNFLVTASGSGRAVLRSSSRSGKVRIIVDYPAGSTPPVTDSNFSRDSRRPFLITDVKPAEDGFVNVFVREVTRP